MDISSSGAVLPTVLLFAAVARRRLLVLAAAERRFDSNFWQSCHLRESGFSNHGWKIFQDYTGWYRLCLGWNLRSQLLSAEAPVSASTWCRIGVIT